MSNSKTKRTTTPPKSNLSAAQRPASAAAYAIPFLVVLTFTRPCASPALPIPARLTTKPFPASFPSVKSVRNPRTGILPTETKSVSPPARSPKFTTPTTLPSAWKSEPSSPLRLAKTSSVAGPIPATTFFSSADAPDAMESAERPALPRNTPTTLSTTPPKFKKATLPPSEKSNVSFAIPNSLPRSKSATTLAQAGFPSPLAKLPTASISTSTPFPRNTTASTALNSPSPNLRNAWPSVSIHPRSTTSSRSPTKKTSNVFTSPPLPIPVASA